MAWKSGVLILKHTLSIVRRCGAKIETGKKKKKERNREKERRSENKKLEENEKRYRNGSRRLERYCVRKS
jgi:hypothetical protein